jgi:RNA polymerase sigma factor (TIGR02999 family)
MNCSEELLSEVYQELRRLAASFLRNERPNHTLQPSALIHEAYLRLSGSATLPAADRAHFLRQAARAMRQVLIDYSRQHRAQKRDRAAALPLMETPAAFEPAQYLVVDDALGRLEQLDPRQAEIVELRFFGGLSVKETADALGISEKTVKREWAVARSWLRGELDRAGDAERVA